MERARPIEAGTADEPASSAPARACSHAAEEGPYRSPSSTSAWPGQRVQKAEAVQLEQVCRSRTRMERTRRMSCESFQISANGVSRMLPHTTGRATHGVTSP